MLKMSWKMRGKLPNIKCLKQWFTTYFVFISFADPGFVSAIGDLSTRAKNRFKCGMKGCVNYAEKLPMKI